MGQYVEGKNNSVDTSALVTTGDTYEKRRIAQETAKKKLIEAVALKRSMGDKRNFNLNISEHGDIEGDYQKFLTEKEDAMDMEGKGNRTEQRILRDSNGESLTDTAKRQTQQAIDQTDTVIRREAQDAISKTQASVIGGAAKGMPQGVSMTVDKMRENIKADMMGFNFHGDIDKLSDDEVQKFYENSPLGKSQMLKAAVAAAKAANSKPATTTTTTNGNTTTTTTTGGGSPNVSMSMAEAHKFAKGMRAGEQISFEGSDNAGGASIDAEDAVGTHTVVDPYMRDSIRMNPMMLMANAMAVDAGNAFQNAISGPGSASTNRYADLAEKQFVYRNEFNKAMSARSDSYVETPGKYKGDVKGGSRTYKEAVGVQAGTNINVQNNANLKTSMGDGGDPNQKPSDLQICSSGGSTLAGVDIGNNFSKVTGGDPTWGELNGKTSFFRSGSVKDDNNKFGTWKHEWSTDLGKLNLPGCIDDSMKNDAIQSQSQIPGSQFVLLKNGSSQALLCVVNPKTGRCHVAGGVVNRSTVSSQGGNQGKLLQASDIDAAGQNFMNSITDRTSKGYDQWKQKMIDQGVNFSEKKYKDYDNAVHQWYKDADQSKPFPRCK